MHYSFLQHGQSSWMEMHQFIGDLITSGHSSSSSMKTQSGGLNAAWGVGGDGAEAVRFRGTSLIPLPTQTREKPESEPGKQMQTGVAQRRGETRPVRKG